MVNYIVTMLYHSMRHLHYISLSWSEKEYQYIYVLGLSMKLNQEYNRIITEQTLLREGLQLAMFMCRQVKFSHELDGMLDCSWCCRYTITSMSVVMYNLST
jgi:hypothetical protein